MFHVRAGDAGDYESFDGLGKVRDHLTEYGAVKPFSPIPLGVECDGFAGQNYVSLYFGPDVGSPERGLTAEEIAELNR